MTSTARLVGKIKWYNDQKGYGFLVVPGSIQDYFLHVSELRKSRISGPIIEGEEMSFTEGQGQKGLKAIDVQRTAPNAGF